MRILIVGGVAGGASAAARLRRLDENATIVLFERGHYISFANCGLPYYIGETIKERSDLLVQTPKAMRSRFGIDVRTDSEVVAIDREKKAVEVRDASGTYWESYDKLILAPGASPIRLPVPGIESENVFTVWSIPDTDRVYDYLNKNAVKTAVVIGGGFVGVEMVENLVERGVKVTLVEMLDQVMNAVDFDLAQYIHMEMNAHGVRLELSQKLAEIAKEDGQTVVKLGGGRQLPADLIITAAGVRPNSSLAASAKLALGPKGHIVVDEHLTTSDPDIFAVGDAIEIQNLITGKKTAVPLAGPANKQGRMVAGNVLGGKTPYRGAQATSIAKVFGKTIASTGLMEKHLLAEGKKLHEDYEVLLAHPNNFAGYYPGNAPIHLKVLYDRGSLKILGAGAVGESGTDKRIDVLAACIRCGATVRDLTELELAYAPPYNTAKDPVNIIGYMAENIEDGLVDTVLWKEVASLDPKLYQLVDVRKIAEFAEGTYPGAVNLPLDEIRDRLGELDPQKTALVFCRAGLRSYIAARILAQHGVKVKSIAGGWLSYEALTYPVR